MPGENLELARRLCEAARSGPPEETVERVVGLAHPRVEFVSRLSEVQGGRYVGHEGVQAYFIDMADAWEEWRASVVDLEELAPDTVLAELSTHAVAKGGFEGDLPSFLLVTIEDGKVRRVVSHASREEALETAGISN
jgi:hypothetical protein